MSAHLQSGLTRGSILSVEDSPHLLRDLQGPPLWKVEQRAEWSRLQRPSSSPRPMPLPHHTENLFVMRRLISSVSPIFQRFMYVHAMAAVRTKLSLFQAFFT